MVMGETQQRVRCEVRACVCFPAFEVASLRPRVQQYQREPEHLLFPFHTNRIGFDFPRTYPDWVNMHELVGWWFENEPVTR